MICKSNSFQNWIKILNLLNTFFIISSLSIICAIFKLKEEKFSILKIPKSNKSENKIAKLAFSTNEIENVLSFSMIDLKNRLKVYKIPTRPDLENESKFFISLDERCYKIEKSKIYLNISNDLLYLSDKKSSSYIIVDNIKNDSLKVTQVCELDKPFSKTLKKSYRLPISYLESAELENKMPFNELVYGEFLGEDKLKKTLSYLLKIKNDVYSVREKDSLFFDKKWKIGVSSNTPYAYIQKVQSEKITLQLWDTDNQNYKKIIIIKKDLPKRNLRIKDLITEVKKRNKKQISLLLGKQKMFLAEEGILVKRNGKWVYFSESLDDDQNDLYLILKNVKMDEVDISILEKNRVVIHDFKVPISSGSFAKRVRMQYFKEKL